MDTVHECHRRTDRRTDGQNYDPKDRAERRTVKKRKLQFQRTHSHWSLMPLSNEPPRISASDLPCSKSTTVYHGKNTMVFWGGTFYHGTLHHGKGKGTTQNTMVLSGWMKIRSGPL